MTNQKHLYEQGSILDHWAIHENWFNTSQNCTILINVGG